MPVQEWRRRRQRSRPPDSALDGQSGLPHAIAGSRMVIDERRATHRSPETESDRIRHEPAGDPLADRHLVAAALGRLTQEHRDVLRELYLRGNSITQAAHTLGIAPGMVKSRIYYALHALRLAIEELRGFSSP